MAAEDRQNQTCAIEDDNDNENGAMVTTAVEKCRGESG